MDKTLTFPLIWSFPLPAADTFELYRRIAAPDTPSFLLESGRESSRIGRFSFFGSDPYLVISGSGTQYELKTSGNRMVRLGKPFEALATMLEPRWMFSPMTTLPFMGGAIGFLSYELVRQFESLPDLRCEKATLPDLEFLFIDAFAAIDHHTRTLHLVFSPSPERLLGQPHDVLYREGVSRLHALQTKIFEPSLSLRDLDTTLTLHDLDAQQRQEDYINRVTACQDFIKAGDIYQANLSHRFDIHFQATETDDLTTISHSLFRRLRTVNPAPFSALLQFDRFALVSSSPERLISLKGLRAETRPIAGTRPRGKTPPEDQGMIDTLITNTKERAEHLMLVDLARNDLGRVCRFGTINVDEFMAVERYSHVTHLVSNISGYLHPSRGPADLIRAIFPGGTITGVPKIRCMEIIEQLEPVRREAYTGSLGYWSWNGNMDLNIIIRTILLTRQCGYLQVGAGIVADSVPAREYEETLYKAQALFHALQHPQPV